MVWRRLTTVAGAAVLATAGACSSLPVLARDAAVEARDAGPCEGASCGGRCVDLARDPSHCGACGQACGAGVDCVRGVCSRRVVQLSAELNHTCALVVDGSVWCWGTNENGEVGDGSPESTRPVPSRVPGLTATVVAAGWTHSCAIVAGGRVWCWGANVARVIADDARAVVRQPEEVPFPGRAVALAVGYGTCALLDDGAVYCRPEFGGVAALPYVRWTDHVVALDGGWGHVCALYDDGTVGCGGRRGSGMFGDGNTALAGMDYVFGPVRPAGLPRVTGLAASTDGNCARTADGDLWCWGGVYQAATNPTVWTPTRLAGVTGVRELWSRGQGFIVRGADGGLRAWGTNAAGGVGDGTIGHRWPPVPMSALDAIAGDVATIAGGVDHACALLRDGTVRCWGGNVRGQIGDGTLGAHALTPTAPRW